MFLLFLLFFSSILGLLTTCLQIRARQNVDKDEAYVPLLRKDASINIKKIKATSKKNKRIRLDPENQIENDDSSMSATTITSIIARTTSNTLDEEPKEYLGNVRLVAKTNKTANSTYISKLFGADPNLASTQDTTYISDATLPDETLRDVPSLMTDDVTLRPYRSDADVVLARNEYYDNSEQRAACSAAIKRHGMVLGDEATCEATGITHTTSDVTTATLPWN